MKCQMDNMCKETSWKEKIGMLLVYQLEILKIVIQVLLRIDDCL